jgi:hypothetical protein
LEAARATHPTLHSLFAFCLCGAVLSYVDKTRLAPSIIGHTCNSSPPSILARLAFARSLVPPTHPHVHILTWTPRALIAAPPTSLSDALYDAPFLRYNLFVPPLSLFRRTCEHKDTMSGICQSNTQEGKPCKNKIARHNVKYCQKHGTGTYGCMPPSLTHVHGACRWTFWMSIYSGLVRLCDWVLFDAQLSLRSYTYVCLFVSIGFQGREGEEFDYQCNNQPV